MKKKSKKFNLIKFFSIILLTVFLIYFVLNSKDLLKIPSKTFIVENGSLSYEEAAAVTSIGTLFSGEQINSFNELQFFTGLEYIDVDAFTGSYIVSVILPDSIREIGDFAFCNCEHLQGIVIPSSVERIGKDPFDYCRSLHTVYVMANEPPALDGPSLFYNNDCVVFVPDDSLSRYLESFDWSGFNIYPLSQAPMGFRSDYGAIDKNEWED